MTLAGDAVRRCWANWEWAGDGTADMGWAKGALE
jgi:hypothetical protein